MSAAAPEVGLCWGTIHKASLVETIEVAARHGFPTLQVPPGIYLDAIEAGFDDRTLRRRLSDAGVRVRLIDCISANIPGMPTDPIIFKGQVMPRFDAASCIAVAEALEAPLVNISHYLGKPVPLEEMAEAVGKVCRQAAERGVAIVLEFVPDSGIRSIYEAQAIVDVCGEPNCSIQLDTWHLARTGGSAADIRALPANAIGAFQLSDRIEPPPGTTYVPMTGRLLPGEGALPLGEIVQAALANSPELTLEVEVFSEELNELPVDSAAARTAAAVRGWREGFQAG
jgi:sugar phosphate isomerase/epimerase